MNGLQQVVCACGQDREGFQHPSVRSIPEIPDAGESHWSAFLHTEIVGHLLFGGFGPFIEATCRDKAAMRADRFSEGGLLMDRFASGVDQPVADGRVFGPMRDQPPASHGQFPDSFGGCFDDRDRLTWRDIPVLGDRRCLMQRKNFINIWGGIALANRPHMFCPFIPDDYLEDMIPAEYLSKTMGTLFFNCLLDREVYDSTPMPVLSYVHDF